MNFDLHQVPPEMLSCALPAKPRGDGGAFDPKRHPNLQQRPDSYAHVWRATLVRSIIQTTNTRRYL